MPYSKIQDLPKQVMSLPTQAKKIFLKAFNKASKDNSEEKAFKIAWSAVKKIYTKKKNKWVLKREIDIKSTVNREGYFWNPSYYFDIILSSNGTHRDGKKVSKKLLNKLYSDNLIDSEGDINHLAIDGNPEYVGLFKKIGQTFVDGVLKIKVAINKAHDKYKEFMSDKKYKDHIKLSAEFYNPVMYGDLILDAEGLGWTVTDNPADYSKIVGKGKL